MGGAPVGGVTDSPLPGDATPHHPAFYATLNHTCWAAFKAPELIGGTNLLMPRELVY